MQGKKGTQKRISKVFYIETSKTELVPVPHCRREARGKKKISKSDGEMHVCRRWGWMVLPLRMGGCSLHPHPSNESYLAYRLCARSRLELAARPPPASPPPALEVKDAQESTGHRVDQEVQTWCRQRQGLLEADFGARWLLGSDLLCCGGRGVRVSFLLCTNPLLPIRPPPAWSTPVIQNTVHLC